MYRVQNKGYMTQKIWLEYLEEVVKPFYENKNFVAVLDNLSCHVSDESEDFLKKIGGEICTLPKNATSVCQPLDVGVFDPLKQSIRRGFLNIEKMKNIEEKRTVVISSAIEKFKSMYSEILIASWNKSIFIKKKNKINNKLSI